MGKATGLTGRLAVDVDRAFPELVLTYQDRLYSGVRSFVGSADAEDVTQEAFIRAHKALHSYHEDRIKALHVSAWLWTIALNLCRNWARTRSRRPQTVQLTFDHSSDDQADEEAVDAVMLDDWKQRLDGLSDAQRVAVVLRHVVGLSYQEIASATERPVGTAKTDVSRGLTALRKIISEEGSP
jgi:RNA polymerase sigma-70 factor (ECF subfamily)